MKSRKRMTSGKSERYFKKTADRTHKFNLNKLPVRRGGIRL
jgi:hypothetical protein